MKIGFIDHYDSFSFNLVDWLSRDIDFSVEVIHAFCNDTDKLTYLYDSAFPLVFSPGPNSPHDVPASLHLMKKSLARVPVMGVCLGFQMLGTIAGLQLRKAAHVRHGVARNIAWDLPGDRIAKTVQGTCVAAVYNSLGFAVAESGALSKEWTVAGRDDAGNVQVLLHTPAAPVRPPAIGLQFHPESFLSTGVDHFRSWWLNSAAAGSRAAPMPQGVIARLQHPY